ncbi:MAG: hypothetical protein HYV41_01450 [Candidatus Magasanikbacteria bacterium]|nr:hypothetical protein [Candidatus Magasanikbacteria bacterium]
MSETEKYGGEHTSTHEELLQRMKILDDEVRRLQQVSFEKRDKKQIRALQEESADIYLQLVNNVLGFDPQEVLSIFETAQQVIEEREKRKRNSPDDDRPDSEDEKK